MGNISQRSNGLYGEYHHALDEKNRLFIPAKLREAFKKEKELILSRGLDGCLFLFSKAEWQGLESKARSLRITDRDARAFTRHLFSGASMNTIDSQGRIPLSQSLKDYAQIKKDVVIIGVSMRLEIWAKERWQKYFESTENNVENIASQLEEFGV